MKANMEKMINRTILDFHPSVTAIYLFGSHASGDQRNESDVDIAVLLPPVKPSARSFELQFKLETQLKKNIDLVMLREVNTIFQKEIIMTGRKIFLRDEYETDEFEMLVISKYQKLNEERKEIIKSALETGTFISS